MLGITVDNASNNDKMIADLAELNESFAGLANHIRCFAHVNNLVAKTVLNQFDTRRGADATAGSEGAGEGDDLAALLAEIEAGKDLEDAPVAVDEKATQGMDEDDDVDEWVDELENLTEEERERIGEDVLPLKLVLAKVSRTFTTYLLLYLTIPVSFASCPSPSSTPRQSCCRCGTGL